MRMSFYQRFRRFFVSSSTIDSFDSGCDLHFGIRRFIQCGTSNIIEAPFLGLQLEDTLVTIENDRRRRNSNSSSSSSSSNSSSSKSDCHETDGLIPRTEERGVKVMEVNVASFAHGLGLRENDVILTVNGQKVDTADEASVFLEKIVVTNKNSRLALEVQRKERGLIRLDNRGDDIEAVDEDLVYSLPNSASVRVKNRRFRKYLTVKSDGKVHLSNFRTKKSLTHFWIHHYQKFSEESRRSKYAVIQHKKSKKCIYSENGQLMLKDAPDGTTLPEDSGYLFDIQVPSSAPRDYFLFECVSAPDKAIGFRSRKKAAMLLDKTDVGVLFVTFHAA